MVTSSSALPEDFVNGGTSKKGSFSPTKSYSHKKIPYLSLYGYRAAIQPQEESATSVYRSSTGAAVVLLVRALMPEGGALPMAIFWACFL